MTCVVGVRAKDGVLLAGDTMAANMYQRRDLKTPKTVQINDLVAIAYCGSLRLGQVLMYYLEDFDDPPTNEDEHRWAVRTLVPEVRKIIEEHGILKIKHNVELLDNAAFLLAVRGRLFDVYDDLSVEECTLDFSADGSGAEVAMGALTTAMPVDGDITWAAAKKIAVQGIQAASEHTPFVSDTVTFVQTMLWTPDEVTRAKEILGR